MHQMCLSKAEDLHSAICVFIYLVLCSANHTVHSSDSKKAFLCSESISCVFGYQQKSTNSVVSEKEKRKGTLVEGTWSLLALL